MSIFNYSPMKLGVFFVLIFVFSCESELDKSEVEDVSQPTETIDSKVFITVLGTVQDGGSPHIGCQKDCCTGLFETPDPSRKVVSLGLIDRKKGKKYIFEATPDFTSQIKNLKSSLPSADTELPDGIFLTHAHIGHYTGLMYLGKEATNANRVPVYCMPKMKSFLASNGPWSQLVDLENISLKEISNVNPVELGPSIKVEPFLVPHRDEFSETVGYLIKGPKKSALFIPDIDKWEKWDVEIITAIEKVDYAFLDATFYDKREINNRDISEIPHPFVIESMKKFKDLSNTEKAKIHFIHFNHTNPLLNEESPQTKEVRANGFNISRINQTFGL